MEPAASNGVLVKVVLAVIAAMGTAFAAWVTYQGSKRAQSGADIKSAAEEWQQLAVTYRTEMRDLKQQVDRHETRQDHTDDELRHLRRQLQNTTNQLTLAHAMIERLLIDWGKTKPEVAPSILEQLSPHVVAQWQDE